MTARAEPRSPGNLSDRMAELMRQRIVRGEFTPGQRLSEASLSEELEISRNTLREVFRLLTQEGLLRHEPNRGVSVAEPDLAAIVDIYRVRRLIECQALAQAYPHHPAGAAMREAVEQALACSDQGDWPGVGTANMAFHRAIVALADSERLNAMFSRLMAELRLAFGRLRDPELLHRPYVAMNQGILQRYEAGDAAASAALLAEYLAQSERVMLAACGRAVSGLAPPQRD